MIKASGAAGGGLTQAETVLNPKGYRITGTTTTNKIVVDPGVTTELTFDNVSITNLNRNENCVTVSHADVTITLVGENILSCENEEYGALVKDGMDDTALTLQCEYSTEKDHKCKEETCGSLQVGGNTYHVTAIGSSIVNRDTEGESGFANLVIKGGVIEAHAGEHNSAIGACCSSWSGAGKGYTKNISITGGIVKAVGGEQCAGLGSGAWTPVDGIDISGGTIYASGGAESPGIGSGGRTNDVANVEKNVDISNIFITGGDTIVKAVGDKATDMPGIGCGKIPAGYPKGTAANVTAAPESGYQGYIQDGTSEEEYNFTDNSPFSSETAISVEKYYTKVYFGPYRDKNTIAKDTKEQIGANHVISKTGGSGFTESQLKVLTKVNGKQEDGNSFSLQELTFTDMDQIHKINKAKEEGKSGDFPLTYTTPKGTKVTVTVSLRDSGTDSAKFDPKNPTPSMGANDFEKDTGGEAFTEEQMKKYGELKAKDKDGNTISLEDFILDADQFQKINEAKTSGKLGVFDLTYIAGDGNKVTVKVSLVKYDEVTETGGGAAIKGMNVISRTGGKGFTESQLRELSKVKAYNEHGQEIPAKELIFSNPDQIMLINQAKSAGKIGDFPLSFETAQGIKVTVNVYLRDDGTDGAKEESGKPEPSIAANDGFHKTGGAAFTKEELIKLCKAKGKDEARNDAELSINKGEMERLNAAKQAGKTGKFSLTFFMAEGKEAKVTVTLTGKHRVSFHSNGGDFTPKTQIVAGGKYAAKPKEPKREGYTFEGWYYIDEDGNEQKWDFGTPVHSDVELKAKWKKSIKGSSSSESADKNGGKKKDSYYWDSEDITKSYGENGVAKTGDAGHPDVLLFMMTAGGGILYLIYRKRRSVSE